MMKWGIDCERPLQKLQKLWSRRERMSLKERATQMLSLYNASENTRWIWASRIQGHPNVIAGIPLRSLTDLLREEVVLLALIDTSKMATGIARHAARITFLGGQTASSVARRRRIESYYEFTGTAID